MSDAINPSHYKHLPVEAIDIIMAAIAKAPSNESACLHGQVLKYLLRCWEKKGIEDLRKAKWYLDRLVASFDDLLAEINTPILEGANNNPTASLNSDKIPKGYRKLGDSSIEARQLGDLRWSVTNKRYVEVTVDEIGHSNQENWAACRKIEEPSEDRIPHRWRKMEIGEDIDQDDKFWYEGRWVSYKDKPPIPRGKLTDFHVTHIRKIETPKRYREPTLADLANGPIECEVRDLDGEPWKAGLLSSIYDSASLRFEGKTKVGIQERWEQCRIEVQE